MQNALRTRPVRNVNIFGAVKIGSVSVPFPRIENQTIVLNIMARAQKNPFDA